MKRICFLFIFFLYKFLICSQDIKLPEIITYIPPSLENKITFTQEDIQNKNLSDLPQLLQSAGIQILSYGAYGLEQKPSIRGFTDETVRVVIDGICVNNPQTGTFDFSSISLDSIEKLEIIKGGFTEGTDDEDAVGGVIYITTKKQGLESILSANTDTVTYFKPETPADTVSQSISFNSPLTENLYINTSAKATYAKNNFRENSSEVHDAHGNLQITDYFGNGNSLTLSDLVYTAHKNIPGPQYSKQPGIQNDYNNNLSLSLFTPGLSPLFTLKNSFNWLSNNRFYSDSKENSEHYINSFKYNLTADFLTAGRIKETAGLSLDYTHLNSTNDGIHDLFSGVIKETTKIYLSPVFSLSLPMAVKISGTNTGFTPKAAISIGLSPFTLTFNTYRMLQFPTMDDLFWQGENYHGNSSLAPEDGFGAEFSADYKQSDLCINTTLFTNYYRNKIQWSADSNNVWSPQNIASAFYSGIDFSASITFLNELLNVELQGEYLYTRLLDKNNEQTYGKKIMWTPDFTASLNTTVCLEYFRFIINANYTGKRYISNMNLSYLKPYVLLNISAEFTGAQHLNPYISINNLLNTKYQAVENYPMPGISLTIGLKAKITYN